MNDIIPAWLSVHDAAIYSGLSMKTIRRLLASGKLTAHRPVRGRILICRNELDSLIRSSTQQLRRGRGIRR
jgi:excisionase family DNA binding protein